MTLLTRLVGSGVFEGRSEEQSILLSQRIFSVSISVSYVLGVDEVLSVRLFCP